VGVHIIYSPPPSIVAAGRYISDTSSSQMPRLYGLDVCVCVFPPPVFFLETHTIESFPFPRTVRLDPYFRSGVLPFDSFPQPSCWNPFREVFFSLWPSAGLTLIRFLCLLRIIIKLDATDHLKLLGFSFPLPSPITFSLTCYPQIPTRTAFQILPSLFSLIILLLFVN